MQAVVLVHCFYSLDRIAVLDTECVCVCVCGWRMGALSVSTGESNILLSS